MISERPNGVFDPTKPCYLTKPDGKAAITGPVGQTITPGQTLSMGVATSQNGGTTMAWLLGWLNLFDYWPLMRGSTGQPANDISGYDTFFKIPPSLDDSGCYNFAGGDYTGGRWVSTCNIYVQKGPYYGTPAGQTLPWTMFTAASSSNGVLPGFKDPFLTNDTGVAVWHGAFSYVELPVFLQPSPYAGFTSSQVGDAVQFADATKSDLQITSWQWNFGDGTATSSLPAPSHVYANPGTYQATLKITTIDGQTDTASSSVVAIKQHPVLSGHVTDLSGHGIQTNLTLKDLDNSTSQVVLTDSSGAYSVTVPTGNYELDPDPSFATGTFTPASQSFDLTADTTANLTFNGHQLSIAIINGANNAPASGVLATVAGSGVIVQQPNKTDGNGNSSAEVAPGTYTVTPVPPTQSPTAFVPATSTSDLTSSDASVSFVLNHGPTVSSVTPNVGPVTGGTSVTIAGTGFTSSGSSVVTAVQFVTPSGSLAAASYSVVDGSTITAATPNAKSVLPSGQTIVQSDVVVSTATQTSPTNAGDQFGFGCDTITNQADGPWVFGGCFNQPVPNDYTGTMTDTLDGLTIKPAPGSDTSFADGGSVGNSVTSTGPVTASIKVGSKGTANLFTGVLNMALGGSPQTLTAPAGAQIGGLPINGSITLTPSAGGVVTGVVTTTLPAIMGSKTAVLTFVSSEAKGLTSVTVAAPSGGNLGQLFGLTINSFGLDIATSTWMVAGTAATSAGTSSAFTASLTYAGTAITGGKLTVAQISVAGILDVSKLTLENKKGAWSGSADLSEGAKKATVAFGFSAQGALTSGSITTGPIQLFGALPLNSLALTYTKGAWALSTTAMLSGGGKLSANLAVSATGEITGGGIALSGGKIDLFGKLTLTDLALAYSTPGNVPTYVATLGVQLPPPATVVTGVKGSLTVTDGRFTAGSLEVTGNVPLADGLFLHQLGASFKAATPTTGVDVCGSMGLTGGPTVNGSALIGVNGAIEYTFPGVPGTTSGLYKISGEMTVPSFVVDGGVLGNLYMTMKQGSGLAQFQLALGPGNAAGHCPIQPGVSANTGLTLPQGAKVTGILNGDVSATAFLVTGAATFTYPALFSGPVTGAVGIDNTDITACASESGKSGSYGFTLTWDGAFTTWNGNCPVQNTRP